MNRKQHARCECNAKIEDERERIQNKEVIQETYSVLGNPIESCLLFEQRVTN